MKDLFTGNPDLILYAAVFVLLLSIHFGIKWKEARDYQEICSRTLTPGANVSRDFAILRGKGFDCRLKSSQGGPGGSAYAGILQRSQVLLIRRDQYAKAMKVLDDAK